MAPFAWGKTFDPPGPDAEAREDGRRFCLYCGVLLPKERFGERFGAYGNGLFCTATCAAGYGWHCANLGYRIEKAERKGKEDDSAGNPNGG